MQQHSEIRRPKPKIVYKICSQCYEERAIFDFPTLSASRDGKAAHCKDCDKLRKNKYYTENKKQVLGKNQFWFKENIDLVRSYNAKWQKNNPIKRKAIKAVHVAIKSGDLVKPEKCESCKEELELQAHHKDYSMKLDVQWLCRLCHKAWHRKNGPGLNGGL